MADPLPSGFVGTSSLNSQTSGTSGERELAEGSSSRTLPSASLNVSTELTDRGNLANQTAAVESSLRAINDAFDPHAPPSPSLERRGSPPPSPSIQRRASMLALVDIHEPRPMTEDVDLVKSSSQQSRRIGILQHSQISAVQVDLVQAKVSNTERRRAQSEGSIRDSDRILAIDRWAIQDHFAREALISGEGQNMLKIFSSRGEGGGVLKPVIEGFDGVLQALSEQRTRRLHNLEAVYSEQTQAAKSNMANSKYFPVTTAWYVGGMKNSDGVLESTMQRIGAEHGIAVVLDLPPGRQTSGDRYSLLLDDSALFKGIHFSWVQDLVDFHALVNEIHYPAIIFFPNMNREDQLTIEHELETSIMNARVKRDPDWGVTTLPDGVRIRPPKDTIQHLGNALGRLSSLKGVSVASAAGAVSVMNLTYNEGGNTLLGIDESGRPYAIIGKDSFALSKTLMENELRRSMTDDEVRLAFAIDYGIDKDNLFFVEQPGSFHLDTSMAIVGSRSVVLNDAVSAADEYQSFPSETDDKQRVLMQHQIKTDAQVAKMFEDKTESDLKRYGFTVIRVPGVFRAFTYLSDGPREQMNFFNMVTATTPEGKKIVIANGMENEYKEKFEAMMRKGEISPDEFYYIDFASSKLSLFYAGGVACRTKTI